MTINELVEYFVNRKYTRVSERTCEVFDWSYEDEGGHRWCNQYLIDKVLDPGQTIERLSYGLYIDGSRERESCISCRIDKIKCIDGELYYPLTMED